MIKEPAQFLEAMVFDTAEWPPEDRFSAWCRHNTGSKFTQSEQGSFSAQARIWLLGEIVLSEHRVDAFCGQRDQRLAQAAPLDHVMLIFPIAGTTRVIGQDYDILSRPGEVATLDYRHALSTDNSRQHGIAISIRRSFLEERSGFVKMRGQLPRSAETQILIEYVRELVKSISSVRKTSAHVLSRILRDLICIASADFINPAELDRRSSLRDRITDYINKIPPGQLSITSILQDVGTTRATLYRIFKGDGGLFAYDRNRRLDMVHRALCARDHRSMTEIGTTFGFADPANLAKLFRRRYGFTMSELRQNEILPFARNPEADDVVGSYRQAVALLSQ